MHRPIKLVAAVAALAGCGQSSEEAATNQAKRDAEPRKRPAHCFFKDPDTKDWAATRDKDGNIVVKGKAYREDPRYKAMLNPATVNGTTAETSPTIGQNDTGYAAPENWWPLTATIPNSGSVEVVRVTCGSRTLAEIKVAPKS